MTRYGYVDECSDCTELGRPCYRGVRPHCDKCCVKVTDQDRLSRYAADGLNWVLCPKCEESKWPGATSVL